MVNPNPHEDSRRPDQTSIDDVAVNTAHRRAFSWKRVLKVVSCFLSFSWLIMLFIIAANGVVFRGPANALIAVITVVAIFPILLYLRDGFIYLLGLPFLFVTAWILWGLWEGLWMIPPWMKLPP